MQVPIDDIENNIPYDSKDDLLSVIIHKNNIIFK